MSATLAKHANQTMLRFLITLIGAANFDAVLECTNWFTVIQAVQICWFNGNCIGADKYVSQLGN